MKDKILGILSSVRFWIITLGSASAYLAYVEVNGFLFSSLLNAISIWLGVVSGIGSLDKWFTLLGSKDKVQPTQ
jgi:ABC-type siderophore export system fused ATPase/permease subunit